MLHKISTAFVLLAYATSAVAEAPKGPISLKPTSAWHVDYADDRCRLARQFGADDELVYAFFDRYGPEESFRLTLAGKPVRVSLDKGEASVQFGPAEEEQKFSFLKGNLGERTAIVFSSGERIGPPTPAERQRLNSAKPDEPRTVEPISAERKKAVRFMKIGRPLRNEVILETGSMNGPLKALDTCIDNLMTVWGIDVERHRTLTRSVRPANNPGQWVVAADYPLNMLSAGQPAIIEFRLSVGADGKATACHIQSTTRPKEFDDAVCKSVMRRAQFVPALDREGKPLASFYRNRVRFEIP